MPAEDQHGPEVANRQDVGRILREVEWLLRASQRGRGLVLPI